jgi:hypothetical protein
MTPFEEIAYRYGLASGMEEKLLKNNNIKLRVTCSGPQARALIFISDGIGPVTFDRWFGDHERTEALKKAGFTRIILKRDDGAMIWARDL